jgi:ribosomal protein S19E (S16A)
MLGRKPEDFITVKDVPAAAFIHAYANHLKKSNKINLPKVRASNEESRLVEDRPPQGNRPDLG